MKSKILELDTVEQCNKAMGCGTCHSLVSVVDLAEEAISQYGYLKCDFYVVLMVEHSCCDYYYGRRTCDFSDGTLVFLTPKETLKLILSDCDSCLSKGKLLAFHKNIISATSMTLHFYSDYSFFNYCDNEALHISESEKKIINDCLKHIHEEARHNLDCYSMSIVARHIELLLDYCRRFYNRQFIVRHNENLTVITQLKTEIDKYINDGQMKSQGLPQNKYWGERLDVSSAYLADLFEHELGINIMEYIQKRSLELAKEWLLSTSKPVEVIADLLGYTTVSNFNTCFKRLTGLLPGDYRMKIN